MDDRNGCQGKVQQQKPAEQEQQQGDRRGRSRRVTEIELDQHIKKQSNEDSRKHRKPGRRREGTTDGRASGVSRPTQDDWALLIPGLPSASFGNSMENLKEQQKWRNQNKGRRATEMNAICKPILLIYI